MNKKPEDSHSQLYEKSPAYCLGKKLKLSILLVSGVSCGESYDTEWLTSGYEPSTVAHEYMVSAAHPLAAQAGRDILQSGGNAIDAAVVVQMVLNVVEPPESGIGGGSFLLFRDGLTGEMSVYDGRETAPAAASESRFQVAGRPLPLWAAVPTGLSTGVPGTLAMLHQAHLELGILPWEELFEEAAALAEEGIIMSERLLRQIDNDLSLWLFRGTREQFVLQRRADPPILKNPELAGTFRLIASEGPDAFYAGPLTRPMIDAATSRWPGRSDLSMQDFRNYTPVRREVVCGTYRSFTICGIPPPSSGGIAVLQILGILEHFSIFEFNTGDHEVLHLIAEASRLAFADRERYIGDPGFVTVPTQGLIDSVYLAERAALIDPDQAMMSVSPGIPPTWEPEPGQSRTDRAEGNRKRPNSKALYEHTVMYYKSGGTTDKEYKYNKNKDLKYERETTGTSHFSISDTYGNVVSMTTSIESPFGNRLIANGYLLNNQLTDFTFNPDRNDFYSPNAVAPGKRPRSSMAPVLVFDEHGELLLVTGSRGGSRIIGYVVKTLIGVLDWGLSLQEAISLPNMLHRGVELEIEQGTAWAEHADKLTEMGHNVRVLSLESGVHGIEKVEKHSITSIPQSEHQQCKSGNEKRESKYYWRGGADPRMEGKAMGGGQKYPMQLCTGCGWNQRRKKD